MCYALLLQIKGEQAVQEQATAWQDIIAAKKEAVGLQVEICFFPTFIIIIAHSDSRVNRKVVLFPELGKSTDQSLAYSWRENTEAGLPLPTPLSRRGWTTRFSSSLCLTSVKSN